MNLSTMIQITTNETPGAVFFGQAALDQHLEDALEIEFACREFELTGDAMMFEKTATNLGLEHDEILSVIANPTSRPARGYA